MARLGDIVEQVRGVSYKPSDLRKSTDSHAIALLRASNIQDGEIIADNVVYVSEDKVNKNQYLQQGDILVCTSSGSKGLVGKAAFFDMNCPMTFGAFCKVIRPKKGDSKYIALFFQSPYYRNTISSVSAGANINNLRNEHFSNLQIHFPSSNEQHKIVTNLDMLTKLISLRKQQLAKLDELVKSRFVEMFGDPTINSLGWPVRKFKDISIVITDGEHITPRRKENGIYLLSARNILNHMLNLDNVDYIDNDEYNRIARRIIPQKGDVLISCSGSIGRCCVVPDRLKFQMVRSVALVRFNSNINPIFAEWLIVSDELQRQISNSATQSSQANLFQGKIRELRGYVPPKDLQDLFAAFVSQVNESKSKILKALAQLETLKKSLMQQYFS